MVLWSLQIALNLLFIAALVYGFRTRQRLRELEEEMIRTKSLPLPLEDHKLPVSQPTAAVENNISVSHTAIVEEARLLPLSPETSRSQATGQIMEKNLSQASLSQGVAERYDRAEGMLAKGIKIQEVAKATGLSVSELRLLEKISTKSH